MCVLVFVGYGHIFFSEYGSLLYKACYYDCGYDRPSYMWYDKQYVVNPDYICPVRFHEP